MVLSCLWYYLAHTESIFGGGYHVLIGSLFAEKCLKVVISTSLRVTTAGFTAAVCYFLYEKSSRIHLDYGCSSNLSQCYFAIVGVILGVI